jgi:hypothetical protein
MVFIESLIQRRYPPHNNIDWVSWRRRQKKIGIDLIGKDKNKDFMVY